MASRFSPSRSPDAADRATRGSASARSTSPPRSPGLLRASEHVRLGLEGTGHKSCHPELVLLARRAADGQVWRVAHVAARQRAPTAAACGSSSCWRSSGTSAPRSSACSGATASRVLLLIVTVIPGIVGRLINLPDQADLGFRTLELCVFLLFVAEYPYVRFFFGIPAWVIGAVILAIEVIQLLGDRNESGSSCSCSSRSPSPR